MRPETAVAVLGAPDVGWAHAASEQWTLGWGIADEMVASRDEEVAPALERAFASGDWFGGIAFDPERLWDGWPAARWFRPRVLIDARKGSVRLSVHGGDGRVEELARALTNARGEPPSRLSPSVPSETVSSSWRQLHAAALNACHGGLEKVVIARELALPGEFDAPRSFLAAAERFPTCRAFLLRNGDTSFIGATPETLCRIAAGVVETEALAGTAAAGKGDGLLRSEKDRREHQLVVDDIRDALAPWVSDFRAGSEPEVLQLPNAVHLRTAITARCGSSAEVVLALHPTAAVNGRPRQAARRFLREREQFARGWYAGVVGRIQEGTAELRVALRSALIRPTEARLFAGVGVVIGSDAQAEWIETEQKLSAMRGALR